MNTKLILVPADYILFVNTRPVGIIEAKRQEEGVRLTVHEDQSSDYATAKLKYLNNEPLPFVYESAGEVHDFKEWIERHKTEITALQIFYSQPC